MERRYTYGTVRETRRTAIFVVRVNDTFIEPEEAADIAERMREKIMMRGEIATDIVVVQGHDKETLRLHGMPYSIGRVRAAMFNAAIKWKPIDLE
ncbi:MAG: hypothetical protein K9G60_02525 [Pseudolabrys sp.]|nr:hypothetical protein [Pseudolabrys sp.]